VAGQEAPVIRGVTVQVVHEDGQVQVSLPQTPGKTVEDTLHLAVAMVTASYKALIEPASDEVAKQEVEG
jgi:hypothetical protein